MILIKHAYTVFLNDNILQEELHHIETCFDVISGYPEWLLKQTFEFPRTSNKNYKNHIKNKNNNTNKNNSADKTVHTIKRDRGINLIKSMKHQLKTHYLKNMTMGLF